MATLGSQVMPKRLKVYIITDNGVVRNLVYTSLRVASDESGIPERSLRRHILSLGSYTRENVCVTMCEVVRIKGRFDINSL